MEQVIEALKTALPGLLGATSQAVVLTKGSMSGNMSNRGVFSAPASFSVENNI